MAWRRAAFKDARVFAEVDDHGQLLVRSGRVRIRYQRSIGAKIYEASAQRVSPEASAPIEDLPQGAAPETTPESTSTGATSPREGRAPERRGATKPISFGKAGTRTKAQTAMAAAQARALIRSLEGQVVLCFTDGGCRGNPGPAGSGAVVYFLDGRVAEASRSLGNQTNNIAELTAIALAFEILEESKIARSEKIAIFTDSSYAHGLLKLGWNAKANQTLVALIRRQLESWPQAAVHWIAGHVGTPGNERADALANEGIEGISRIRWTE